MLTPGAGAMFCGNCLRDNALVAALRALGHSVVMVPLYLPLTLDEADQSAGTPLFFSGINVYLEQKSAWFRAAPEWLHHWLASRRLLKWVAGRSAQVRASELGELTLSMLRGEEGRQAREVEELCAWLKTQPQPDVICLSNALLMGLVHRLRSALDAPVVCFFQGEDTFLDSLPEPLRTECWLLLARRAAEAGLFIAPSRYFGELMGRRLGLSPDRVKVVLNGIRLEPLPGEPPTLSAAIRQTSLAPAPTERRAAPNPLNAPGASPIAAPGSPILGFFARMCREKGLDTLVEAFVLLRRRDRVQGLKFRAGGSFGPAEAPLMKTLRARLRQAGLESEAEFFPNVDHLEKCALLRSFSVLSVPARYGEAFGLYVLEALAAGVPVVQPRIGAFPELIDATGGGLLCEPGDPQALAAALEELLLDPGRARALGDRGRAAVLEYFNADRMAREVAEAIAALREPCPRNTAELR